MRGHDWAWDHEKDCMNHHWGKYPLKGIPCIWRPLLDHEENGMLVLFDIHLPEVSMYGWDEKLYPSR
jgi:hypothetical protein